MANTITGNAGANILNGGADTLVDTLIGGAGGDTYVLAGGRDAVTEIAGAAGVDTATSTATRSLAIGGLVNVENLTLLGAAANATGNALANVITGNAGANILNGLAARDTLVGGNGSDTYFAEIFNEIITETNASLVTGGNDLVNFSGAGTFTLGANVERLTLTRAGAVNGTGNGLANTITGGTGANTLTGNVGNDILGGMNGNDTLIGGIGVDTLTGGSSNDFFVFSAPLSAANRDIVTDFNHAFDTFRLENAVMAKLGAAGALAANKFFAGAAAHDADDRIVYNKTTGALSYDANGNLAGGVTLLATLTTLKPTLTAADFVII